MSVSITVVKKVDNQTVYESKLDLISSEEVNIFKEYTKLTFVNILNIIRYRIFENIKIQNQINVQLPIEASININSDDYKNKNDKYMEAALNIFVYRNLYTELISIFTPDNNYMILID